MKCIQNKERRERKLGPSAEPHISQSHKASAAEEVINPWDLDATFVHTSDVEAVGCCTAPSSPPTLGQKSPDALSHSARLHSHTVFQNMPE